jgi:hypothetical protein
MASCGGRSGNAQQQSGGGNDSGNGAKVETKASAQVAGSMDAMAAGDIPQSWTDGLAAKTGIKKLGKPKCATEVKTSDWEDGFNVNFYCEKPTENYAAYVKAIWDLTKSVAEKGELLLRNYDGDAKYKTAATLEQAEDDVNDYRHRWHYSYGGVVWRVSMDAREQNNIRLTVEKD